MAWHVKSPSDEEIERFRRAWEESGIREVVAHDSYLVNVCSGDIFTAERSVKALGAELERCERMGLRNMVMHPGAHTGRGEEAGLKGVAEGIDEAMEAASGTKVRILLETTAGSGTVLGWRFEQLARIIEMSRHGERLGVCFDTAHVLGAGYDLRSSEGYDRVMEEFERVLGTERIGCFHLNDSKTGMASRVDRHEQIGHGEVGLEAFRMIVNDERFADVPKVIETPKGRKGRKSWDRINLETLRGLMGRENTSQGKEGVK